MRRLRRGHGGDAVTLWSVTTGGQRHEVAAGEARGAAHCYGWSYLAPGEVERVTVERDGARSVWRVERTVAGVKATMEVA